MKQFWYQLQPRERLTLILGGAALLLMAVYALIIDPYQREVARLESSVAEQRALLGWMQQAATEIKRQRAEQGRSGQGRQANQSLLTVVDSSVKGEGLGKSLERVQPDGGSRVQVWLKQAEFDRILLWLDGLERRYGIRVGMLNVEPLETPGMVKARLVLERQE